MKKFLLFTLTVLTLGLHAADNSFLSWEKLSELPPNPGESKHLGVAGPFVGVHNDALIVAGGANFPEPIWENGKVWYADAWVLTKTPDGGYKWHTGSSLDKPIAYGASVITSNGVLCLGGCDSEKAYADVFLLQWDPVGKKLKQEKLPSLPSPCAFTAAAAIGDTVYVAGGTEGTKLATAMNNFWCLDLASASPEWKTLPAWPGSSRAFNVVVKQHNGKSNCIYVMSGRRENEDSGKVEFLTDGYEFNLAKYQAGEPAWKRISDAPRCFMAGTGIGIGQSHIYILGGADGSLMAKADELKDAHPGFPKEALSYHTITDSWSSGGTIPQNHVTTNLVEWDGGVIVASGEIRPRRRSPQIWKVTAEASDRSFGSVNYVVLFGYLLAMTGIGAYFATKNKNTDDYFRGGMKIPWWAAGCSIFATMLSSLTYTGIPSKAFAQNWEYILGNAMIIAVAPIAIYIALPFYRRIDATSAYEYLEKRFNRSTRLFGSLSFTLFHIFRMAVVMSLTALALSIATPLSPAASVLLMGVLCIIYCTMGGVEAVIWTDTIQTFVLMGGALLAFALLISGVDGGFSGFMEMSRAADKFHVVNMDFSLMSYSRMAVWVVIIGAFGQNVSSYTADQAVVQRYMTTPNEKLAARAIWTNAILCIPASLIFFSIGAALFAFYKSNPGKLDPTITTDQIFPLFIAKEMPIGLAGLIVAGVFAAAQSTISTSMNSAATTIVTDFMRPYNFCKDDHGYLKAARLMTLLIGVAGTLIGLVFVNPEIRSLFDQFIKVIGLFMGVLGGLFCLGVLTKRANGKGALTGAFVGAAVMFCLWKFSNVNGYLYTTTGILSCFTIGYFVSLLTGASEKSIEGLTIHSLFKKTEQE